MAKVKANTEAKLAAVAMLMLKSLGDMRQDRIERARREARRKGRQRDDVEAGGSAIMRPRRRLRHQRARSFRDFLWFRSPSKAISGSQQAFELAQRHHVGPVGRRVVGIGVGFDEDAGDADRDRRARQHRHEFALAAG